jgi:hypothetical protein
MVITKKVRTGKNQKRTKKASAKTISPLSFRRNKKSESKGNTESLTPKSKGKPPIKPALRSNNNQRKPTGPKKNIDL